MQEFRSPGNLAGVFNATERRRVWLWSYVPLFLWIAVIFFLSSPSGSAANTSLIVGPLLHFFFPDISDVRVEFVHAIVRKSAHFTEYAILALLAIRAFTASTGILYKLRWVLPLVLVAAVAALDEFNQSFEPSRTSSAWDSVLDLTGGTVAILLCLGVSSLSRSRRVPSSASPE